MSSSNSIRAVRGATCLTADNAAEMTEAVVELLTEIFSKNDIKTDEIVSIIFTATPDIHSSFPAAAARQLDLGSTPLICAQELDITGALERVIRIMATVESTKPKSEIKHIYLRGAEVLRQDIAQ